MRNPHRGAVFVIDPRGDVVYEHIGIAVHQPEEALAATIKGLPKLERAVRKHDPVPFPIVPGLYRVRTQTICLEYPYGCIANCGVEIRVFANCWKEALLNAYRWQRAKPNARWYKELEAWLYTTAIHGPVRPLSNGWEIEEMTVDDLYRAVEDGSKTLEPDIERRAWIDQELKLRQPFVEAEFLAIFPELIGDDILDEFDERQRMESAASLAFLERSRDAWYRR